MGLEKTFGHTITADLNLTDLPEIAEPRQGLALALMREGRGLSHPAYAFLSFYRVLEAAIPAKARGPWVADNLDLIMDRAGKEAVAELKESGVNDIGNHLYKSGRMAIAHVQNDTIINPDDASDFDRIAGELHIFDSDTRALLSRVDAFLPCNYWADHDTLNKQIDEWKAEAVRRKQDGL